MYIERHTTSTLSTPPHPPPHESYDDVDADAARLMMGSSAKNLKNCGAVCTDVCIN